MIFPYSRLSKRCSEGFVGERSGDHEEAAKGYKNKFVSRPIRHAQVLKYKVFRKVPLGAAGI